MLKILLIHKYSHKAFFECFSLQAAQFMGTTAGLLL